MTTVLQARPRRFVSTPSVERVAVRALRYLQSGFSVHLRGPAGTGKTTLALHLADLLTRPIMLIFGDDEFKTSDLIGNQSGYTRKKVVDNFIHSVVKVEDELRQNWVDSRLTLACREGFTLVYDEFNRSRPEVNNVLLSALEEKLLVLPPSGNRTEYIRVNPHFRAIFTSNPEEYAGVHDTQDALLDRLVTINMPEPDELTQQEILVQKTEIDRASALLIVRFVKAFRVKTGNEKTSGLRSCLMIAKVCQEHGIVAVPENPEFRDVCCDVLLSRSGLPLNEGTRLLWELLNEFIQNGLGHSDFSDELQTGMTELGETNSSLGIPTSEALSPIAAIAAELELLEAELSETERLTSISEMDATAEAVDAEEAATTDLELEEDVDAEPSPNLSLESEPSVPTPATSLEQTVPHEQEIYEYLERSKGARLSQIEKVLGLDRFHTVDAIRSLTEKGAIVQRDRLFIVKTGGK